MATVENTVENSLTKIMDNPLVVGVLAIVLAMYGPRLSPQLPLFIRNAFNNSVFRFLVMLLVIFVSLRDIRLSFVVAILFMILMSSVMNQNIKEDFEQQLNEYYSNYNLYNSVEHFENSQLDKEEQDLMDADLNNQVSKNNNFENQSFDDQMKQIVNTVNKHPELGISDKCVDYFNNRKPMKFEQGSRCLNDYIESVLATMATDGNKGGQTMNGENTNGENVTSNGRTNGTNGRTNGTSNGRTNGTSNVRTTRLSNTQPRNVESIMEIKDSIQNACNVFNNNLNN